MRTSIRVGIFLVAGLLASGGMAGRRTIGVSSAWAGDAFPKAAPAETAELKDLGVAPPIELEVVGSGESVVLGEMLSRGPVLVDFWATWCGPCRKAMVIYSNLYRRYGSRGFQVLAVSLDSPRSVDKVRLFALKYELPYPVVLDADRKVGKDYGVRVLPTSFLIDMDGHIVLREMGYRPDAARHLAPMIEALLPPSDSE